jgi:predicted ABC-type transport system involved in lysophospholipase L1 biosynthesis ATPase subunit
VGGPEPVATAPLVRLDGVSKTYRAAAGDTRVLRSARLELLRGQTTSLVGVSGSGKSTLISLLAGLLLPDEGAVEFDGGDITALDDAARAELGGAGGATERAASLLSELGLADRLDHLPRRMSGGEVQRAAVAVALANEPDLLLADEVTGELDSGTAEQVMGVILDAWRDRGLTVLFVTHSGELAALAEQRLRLSDGQVASA